MPQPNLLRETDQQEFRITNSDKDFHTTNISMVHRAITGNEEVNGPGIVSWILRECETVGGN